MPSSLHRLACVAVICAAMVSVVSRPLAQPDRSFPDWLADLRREALERGIGAATVESALTDLEILPVVLDRDRTQAERTLSLDKYLARRLTRAVTRRARDMAARYAGLLGQIDATYGVPGRVVVSVWGLESNFGRFTGVRPTIRALATLAYDDRRAAMFRLELFTALQIVDRGEIAIGEMKGSWAGAMGQPQFMPSSYLEYAQDFDGDGRRDIWHSDADALASIANYLKGHGWSGRTRWGREVKLSPAAANRIADSVLYRSEGCEAVRQMTEPLPLARWRRLGVRLPGGRALPSSDRPASLVKTGARTFLVYDNYLALLAYNCAHSYALSAGLLADRIGD